MEKIGTVTVSVFTEKVVDEKNIIDDESKNKIDESNEKRKTVFYIQADNEDVLQVSYIIEDTLKLY